MDQPKRIFKIDLAKKQEYVWGHTTLRVVPEKQVFTISTETPKVYSFGSTTLAISTGLNMTKPSNYWEVELPKKDLEIMEADELLN